MPCMMIECAPPKRESTVASLESTACRLLATCSMIVEDDKTVKLYYGAADYVQCVALGTLEDIVYACKNW